MNQQFITLSVRAEMFSDYCDSMDSGREYGQVCGQEISPDFAADETADGFRTKDCLCGSSLFRIWVAVNKEKPEFQKIQIIPDPQQPVSSARYSPAQSVHQAAESEILLHSRFRPPSSAEAGDHRAVPAVSIPCR